MFAAKRQIIFCSLFSVKCDVFDRSHLPSE